MTNSPLVIDIETVGLPWDDLDPGVRQYLLDRARTEEERAAVPDRLALHPATGRIVAIGLWRPDQDRGGVLVEGEDSGWQPFPEFDGDSMIFRGSEERLLREFWRYVSEGAGTIVTFNGRSFDGPFLMLRSVMLGITPTRNLVPYRYSFREHCDLAEVLTFRGLRRLESLDFWCRQMGIDTPKADLDGARVAAAYREGRLDDIARYCLRDVRATAQLYLRLQPLIELLDRT